MSKRLAFVLIIVAVLFVLLTMAFAQDVPFHAEVLAQTARMRWGPGPTFAVQHYANAGHILLVLEVDADSDPPWTWYYARTPSGAQSWIRADLVRRRDGDVPVQQRVSNPTGNYPVRDNNLCNTNLFRPCQEGADFQLWEAGYWANDRYNHWESGGWDLNVVFYMNPCRSDRVCPRREDWDSGRLEAEMRALTQTPDATLTPLVVTVVVTGEAGVTEYWVTTTDNAVAQLLLDQTGTTSANLYTPPHGLYPGGTGVTQWGEFILNSESISVDCYYWHNAFGEENVKSGRFGVILDRLLERTADSRPNAEDITASRLNCVSGNIQEPQVVARQWKITVSRSYSGRSQIGRIHWRLEATYGDAPTTATDTTCGGTCIKEMNTMNSNLYDYIRSPMPPRESGMARTPRTITPAITAGTCTLRTSTSGVSPRGIKSYEHTCTGDTASLEHTLTFRYTRDETKGFAPQPTPG